MNQPLILSDKEKNYPQPQQYEWNYYYEDS